MEHAANVEALAVSRDEAEELVANWESELEGERSAAQAVAEQVRDLEAELQHRAGELEEAMAWGATVTQARDEPTAGRRPWSGHSGSRTRPRRRVATQPRAQSRIL